MWWFLAIGFLHKHIYFILQRVLFVEVQMINHYLYLYTGHIYVIIRALIFVDGKAILTSYIILFMCLVL